MALSQNVVINFLTKFDKKGLQRATKELKGFDKLIASSKFAGKAALVTAAIGGAIALDRLARASISAALEQERLDKTIEQSLSSINQLGQLEGVKRFITDLQSATNITEDQLTPALNGLIIQTGDLTKAQNLLGVAIDTSKGANVDLATVTDALGKASRGQFRALGQLGLGFNAATAQAMGLGDITDYLTLKFGGSAQRATETFGAKLDALKISANEAQENLGKGFITAAEIIIGSSNATDVFGAKLESLGLNGGYVLIAIADRTKTILDGFTKLNNKIDSSPFLRALFNLENIPVLGGYIAGFRGLAEEGKKIAENTEATVVQTKEQIEAAAKLAALQAKFDKFAKDALDKTKKLTKEKAAQAALDKKRADLESMFDMEKINLQAALSRKLSAEDEIRVKILQRLADGTKAAVDEGQRYADVLKVIEDGKITSEEIDYLAKTWGMTNKEVLLYLNQLFAANDEIKKMLALVNQVKLPTIPGLTAPSVGFGQSLAQLQAQSAQSYRVMPPVIDPLTGELTARGRRNIPDFMPMASGGVVTQPTRALIGEAGAEAVIPLDRMGGMGATVNVNVAGSVISEGQLQSVIQDVLYNLNRTGAVTQLANLGR